MCGRYRLSRRKEVLAEHFGVDDSDLDWEPRYNIAPTQPVPVVRSAGAGSKARISLMRWGLIPSWAGDAGIGARTINARAETAESKPSFRDPLRKQRCLIPADGFYEWQRAGKQKQPFCFEVGEGAVFAFAGLWDRWRGPSGEWVESCTILTTTPNQLLADVHDRMPAILAPRQYERWLDPAMQDAGRALALIEPFEAAQMHRYAVSTLVNRVTEDGPGCSARVELPPVNATLFD